MISRPLLSAAISSVLASFSFAQTTPIPTQDPNLASHPTVASPAAEAAPIQLRSLPAVLDARERRQDWHQAAQEAADKVQVDAIKSQLIERLSGVTPIVANALVAHPQENALVEVNVFKGADGKQALASVTFDGLGSDLGADFFAGVLADVIKPPEAEGIPQGLTFDPSASSYVVFFLGNKGLQAGDIAQPKLKQSIIAASNHQQELAAHQDQVALERSNLQHDTAAAQQQAVDSAQQASAVQPQQVIPEYPYQNYSVNDGYYYPGIGVPIIINADGYSNTPEWRDRQRRREETLERKYRESHPQSAAQQTAGNQTAGNVSSGGGGVNTPPGTAGVANAPGASGVRVPPGGAGIANRPGSAGIAQTPGSAGVVIPPGRSGVTGSEANGVNTPPARSGVEGSAGQAPTHSQSSGSTAGHQAPAATGGNSGGGSAGGGSAPSGPAAGGGGGKK